MTLKFYNISDDRRQLVKTLIDVGADKNLTATLTGSIKTDCDIIDPVFEVSYNSDLMTSNYLYVADLHRYYYITNIKVGKQRLFISCHVDVLMSYSTDIMKLRCVIARQEGQNRSNRYLNDGMWHNLQKKETLALVYTDHFDDTGSYVFCIGGKS